MRTNPALVSLGEYPIAKLQEKARALRAAGRRLVDFSIGDPLEPTPTFIPEALRRAVPAVSQYPTTKGLPALRAAIAGYVERRFGVAVDPDTQIIPTTGSKEAIFSTALAFVDRSRGDGVIWPTPGYPIYERGALLAGARAWPIRLEGDFVFRTEMIPEDAWRDASLVWTCSPHNPAGSVMSMKEIEAMYRTARSHDALFCADECYVDLYDDEPPASVFQVAGAAMTGALSYLSLSKRSGMTGYRSAAVIGDASAITLLAALRSSTGTAPPEFTQAAALAAWSDDGHVAERRSIFSQKRAVLRKAFEGIGLRVVGSTAGLYLWIEVGDDEAVAERLLDCGIVVSPGRAFGSGGEGFIRLALVPTLDDCDEAAQAVVECLTAN